MFANQEIPGYSFGRSGVAGNPYVSAVWTIHKHRNHITSKMKTNGDSKPHQPQAATTPSKAKNGNFDNPEPLEALKQLMVDLEPVLKFHMEAEKAAMDDVTIHWDVTSIRGKDTVFAQTRGSSTLNMLLEPSMMIEAMPRVEQEITDKIIVPMVGAFQDFVNRVALEELAAEEAVPAPDDLMDDDLR